MRPGRRADNKQAPEHCAHENSEQNGATFLQFSCVCLQPSSGFKLSRRHHVHPGRSVLSGRVLTNVLAEEFFRRARYAAGSRNFKDVGKSSAMCYCFQAASRRTTTTGSDSN